MIKNRENGNFKFKKNNLYKMTFLEFRKIVK